MDPLLEHDTAARPRIAGVAGEQAASPSALRRRWWAGIRRLRSLSGDARAFWAGYLLLLPLFLAPLFVTRYLPGLDLPFHLSMTDMLLGLGGSNDSYAVAYGVESNSRRMRRTTSR
jgi:hypothetical protein